MKQVRTEWNSWEQNESGENKMKQVSRHYHRTSTLRQTLSQGFHDQTDAITRLPHSNRYCLDFHAQTDTITELPHWDTVSQDFHIHRHYHRTSMLRHYHRTSMLGQTITGLPHSDRHYHRASTFRRSPSQDFHVQTFTNTGLPCSDGHYHRTSTLRQTLSQDFQN